MTHRKVPKRTTAAPRDSRRLKLCIASVFVVSLMFYHGVHGLSTDGTHVTSREPRTDTILVKLVTTPQFHEPGRAMRQAHRTVTHDGVVDGIVCMHRHIILLDPDVKFANERKAPALDGGTRVAELAVTRRAHDHGEAARRALALDEVGVGGKRMGLAADRPRAAVGAPVPAPRVAAAHARFADHARLLVVGAVGSAVAREAEGGLGSRAAVGMAAWAHHVYHSRGGVALAEGATRLAGRTEGRLRLAAVGLAAWVDHVEHSGGGVALAEGAARLARCVEGRPRLAAVGLAVRTHHVDHSGGDVALAEGAAPLARPVGLAAWVQCVDHSGGGVELAEGATCLAGRVEGRLHPAAVGLAVRVHQVDHSGGGVELAEGATRLAGRVEGRLRQATICLAVRALHVNHSGGGVALAEGATRVSGLVEGGM
eukprot:scaffold24204_cov84-Isochrysis_galbana.AAC.1